MSKDVVGVVGLTFVLSACAGRLSHQPDAQTATHLEAAYACVVSTMKEAGYPVKKDDQRLTVTGQIREEVSAAAILSQGGVVSGGNIGASADFRDPPAPYEVDGVIATVLLDRKTGEVRVQAEAYTGGSLTAHSGYVKRSASNRGTNTVHRVEACANDA